jgi:hypothetical protein
MGVNGNGTALLLDPTVPRTEASQRVPRRVILLESDEGSVAAQVLAEYSGPEVSGRRLHADVQRLAAENLGAWVAAEWLGSRGWNRFLWCRR